MHQIMEVDVETTNKWADENTAILIDVREVHELQKARIQGAIHIPMSNLTPDAIPKNADKKIVFFCAGGMRSMQVGQNLINNHTLREAYTMIGGIAAWAQAGLPVEHD